ncbi:hypothetical protein PR048_018439 [Dryococelus australis]|uniref:Uncharacterized protein n=1 Tax=Dryococelus australis TaxID=614101 RepID=A0ABQ9HCA2_9NEOP|nr:hypothetical protein PR048_018439 [Dryococelus australis]
MTPLDCSTLQCRSPISAWWSPRLPTSQPIPNILQHAVASNTRGPFPERATYSQSENGARKLPMTNQHVLRDELASVVQCQLLTGRVCLLHQCLLGRVKQVADTNDTANFSRLYHKVKRTHFGSPLAEALDNASQHAERGLSVDSCREEQPLRCSFDLERNVILATPRIYARIPVQTLRDMQVKCEQRIDMCIRDNRGHIRGPRWLGGQLSHDGERLGGIIEHEEIKSKMAARNNIVAGNDVIRDGGGRSRAGGHQNGEFVDAEAARGSGQLRYTWLPCRPDRTPLINPRHTIIRNSPRGNRTISLPETHSARPAAACLITEYLAIQRRTPAAHARQRHYDFMIGDIVARFSKTSSLALCFESGTFALLSSISNYGDEGRRTLLDTRCRVLPLPGDITLVVHPVRYVLLTPTRKKRRLLWCRGRKNWGAKQNSRTLFTDERLFSLTIYSRRLYIWRERATYNHLSNIVWDGIMPGARTDLHIFQGVSVTGDHSPPSHASFPEILCDRRYTEEVPRCLNISSTTQREQSVHILQQSGVIISSTEDISVCLKYTFFDETIKRASNVLINAKNTHFIRELLRAFKTYRNSETPFQSTPKWLKTAFSKHRISNYTRQIHTKLLRGPALDLPTDFPPIKYRVPQVDAVRREHRTPVQSPILSGDVTLDVHCIVVFIAPAIFCLAHGKKLAVIRPMAVLILHMEEKYTMFIQTDAKQGFQKCSFDHEQPIPTLCRLAGSSANILHGYEVIGNQSRVIPASGYQQSNSGIRLPGTIRSYNVSTLIINVAGSYSAIFHL